MRRDLLRSARRGAPTVGRAPTPLGPRTVRRRPPGRRHARRGPTPKGGGLSVPAAGRATDLGRGSRVIVPGAFRRIRRVRRVGLGALVLLVTLRRRAAVDRRRDTPAAVGRVP